MKVFISWSGEPSRTVAQALRQWLPDVLQGIVPWMSHSDLAPGERWGERIQSELENTSYGILCLTRGNQDAPWILYEAGALAKSLSDASFVCPYLIGIEPAQLKDGPLTRFQAKRATKDDTRDIVRAINRSAQDAGLPESQVDRAFEKWWPDLERQLSALPSEPSMSTRTVDEMMVEVVEGVRAIRRILSLPPASDQTIRLDAPVLRVFAPEFGTVRFHGPEMKQKVREALLGLMAPALPSCGLESPTGPPSGKPTTDTPGDPS